MLISLALGVPDAHHVNLRSGSEDILQQNGLNQIVIDVGESLVFPSHPELVVKGNWSDSMWTGRAEFLHQMPKTVLQSNWYYRDDFSEAKLKWNADFEKKGGWGELAVLYGYSHPILVFPPIGGLCPICDDVHCSRREVNRQDVQESIGRKNRRKTKTAQAGK